MNTCELYLYNLSTPKGVQIKALCKQLKVTCKKVNVEQYLLPIGVVTGLLPPPVAPVENKDNLHFLDEMLLFKGFANEEIADFLTAYRNKGIASVELKAGMTPHNVNWNSIELHHELVDERDSLRKMKE
ncbi:MAG: DUF3783 domain-containing protein [Bacteroidaceae bacterium]|nr:DUF3783 domain-containing protein [Bacteroidaceae bacterium]